MPFNGFGDLFAAGVITGTVVGIYYFGKNLFELARENLREYQTTIWILNDHLEYSGKSPADALHEFRAGGRRNYSDLYTHLTRMPGRSTAVRHFRHIHSL